MNRITFEKPKTIEELKGQYNIKKVSLVTSANLYPLFKGIEYEGNVVYVLEKKREFPIKRKMDSAIESYTNDMLRDWNNTKKKLITLKNRIKEFKKLDYNNTQTINRIGRIPFKYKKQFVEVADRYGLNLAILDKIVLNSSLLVNARYDSRKNLMEMNPDYLEQHGMIRIGDSGELISETAKTFIHEFGHCVWYNSLTEEDRRYWQSLSRFLQRGDLTGDMTQYIVGEKKRFDGSTMYSPFYTVRDDSFVSVYARFNVREDWAECFLYYKVAPKTLERIDNRKYTFIGSKMGDRVTKDLSKQDEEELYSPTIEDPHKVRDKIISTLDGLKDNLSYKAKEHITNAYNLGRQKGVYYTGAAFLAAIQQKDKEKVQEILNSNDEYLDGFMDDMVDEYDDILFTKTPSGIIESEREFDDIDAFDNEFSDVMDTQEHRLSLYAINGLSLGLIAGLISTTEDMYAGGVWHTSNDDRVCDGCDRLDGQWMSYDAFDALYGNNECDGNCRCGELFEPTLAPGDSFEMMLKGGQGSGCRGENCGRPKGSGEKDNSNKEVFNLESTGVSFYDNLFGPRGDEKDNVDDITQKEYYSKYKGIEGKVVMMLPDEYLSKIPHQEPSQESAEKIKNAIKNGSKINIPYLDYSEGGRVSQEGRNRAYVARDMGIEKIPVLVVTRSKSTEKIQKSGQNAYAVSGELGSTVRETHPELDIDKKCPKCGLKNCKHIRN